MDDSTAIYVRIVVMMQWQFPCVMTFILLYPWLLRGRFDCLLPEDVPCSQCHWTDVSLFSALPFSTQGIPLSISGIIADNLELQLFCYSSLLYTMISFFLFISSHASQSLRPGSLGIVQLCLAGTLSSFFFCLFAFPLRLGCSQSWLSVLCHLTFLALSLISAHQLFTTCCSLPLSPSSSSYSYSAYSSFFFLAAAATCAAGGLGTVLWAFRPVFAIGEIVLLVNFAAWSSERVREIQRWEASKKNPSCQSIEKR